MEKSRLALNYFEQQNLFLLFTTNILYIYFCRFSLKKQLLKANLVGDLYNKV